MGKVRRIMAQGREVLPFGASVMAALVAVLVAGETPQPRPEPPAPRVAQVAPDGAVQQTAGAARSEFAALKLSRGEDIDAVREHFDEVARKHAVRGRVAKFLPLYGEAERVFGVNWRLIASVHRQETAFSASETTYHGRNFAGCCAGPMQFNLTNGPPSTWQSYKDAYREGVRPESYHNETEQHPSIYDDFDAIMAAGKLLRDNGGDGELGRSAWYAAYDYYGHDLFGIQYASEVTARARGYESDGFCVNCLPDADLVAALDDRFGRHERIKLIGTAEQETTKDRKRAKQRRARARAAKRRKLERRRAAEVQRRAAARADQRRRDRARDREREAPSPTPAPTRTPRPQRPAKPRPTASPKPTATPTPTPPPATPTPNVLEDLLDGGGQP